MMSTIVKKIKSVSLLQVVSIIALITSLAGNILVNYKVKEGFIIWIVSNILWIIVNFIGTPNISQIIMFIIYMGLNVHGYVTWLMGK